LFHQRGVHWLSKKPNVKLAGVIITAIVAIGICVVGYQVANQRQYQQRVAYASSAASNEEESIQELKKKLAGLYADDEQELIKKDVSQEDVRQMSSEVHELNTTAEDFQIEEDAVPDQVQELDQEKQELSEELADISDKLQVQEQTDNLFTEDVASWQSFEDEMIIKEKLKEEAVSDINETLSFFDEGAWVDLVKDYTASATDQLDERNEIQDQLDEYEEEPDSFTYENYLSLEEQISQVASDDIQSSLEDRLDAIAEKAEISTETPASTEEAYAPENEEPAYTEETPEYSEAPAIETEENIYQ